MTVTDPDVAAPNGSVGAGTTRADRLPDERGGRRRRGLSARTRILLWLLLPVAVAIASLVLITARVMLVQLERDTNRELTHETAKFRTFAEQVDPVTDEPFTSVDALLSSYLSNNVPEEDETFFSIVDGRAHRRSAPTPPARLDTDRGFVTRAADATEPTWGTADTSAGEARHAVIPVTVADTPGRGALVMVEFTQPDRDRVWSTIRLLGIVGSGSLLLAGVIGWFVTGRVLAPIRAVRTTAAQIGETDLSRRIEVTGTDDVAQLAETFNRMLDRVERAFTTQREFLDDAGHELRTPITIIRGHLELAGTGSTGPDGDTADRVAERELVIAELDRMSRIVDDLLMLAKAEQPDFVIEAPVDLTELVVETLAKVRALAPRRFTVTGVAEATTMADGQRLTQALTQLVDNAIRHTGPDDEIALGSRVQDGTVILTVADTGSGVPVDQQQRIFERFSRGSGTRRPEGAGLGLAIVTTIARAHGGRVRLISEPGHGATFTVEFPHVPVEPGLHRAAGSAEVRER